MVLGRASNNTAINLMSPSALVTFPNIIHSGSSALFTKTSDGGIKCLRSGTIRIDGFIRVENANATDDIQAYAIAYRNSTDTFL